MKLTRTQLDKLRIPKMEMGPIKAALGPDAPKIDPTTVGRYRLVSSLKNKYGSTYKNHPEAQRALQHFDTEKAYFHSLVKTRMGKD